MRWYDMGYDMIWYDVVIWCAKVLYDMIWYGIILNYVYIES